MTTDLLDLARRVMASSLGSVAGGPATTSGDDRPAADVRTDPRDEDPSGPRGGDLLAIARSFGTDDATDTGCAKSEIRGKSPPASPLSAHLSLLAQPDAAGTARRSPPELPERREPGGRRRCYTCGQVADGTWDDGSPRWHHGHDPVTGQRWTMPPRRARVGQLRTCPVCAAEHAVGTTCGPLVGSDIDASDRPGAGIDLLAAALAVFGDDVERVITVIDPSGTDHGRPSRGHRLRDKREKREKGVLDPGLIPLFGEDVDGSDPPGTPA